MIKKAMRIGQTLWVHFEGKTFTVNTAPAKSRRTGHGSGGDTGDGIIESPMPGKVFKVVVAVGDHVKLGQAVCVIEAMKMEYSLKAPFDGKIKAVFKSPGNQVLLGDKILEIEKSEN